MPNLTYTAQGSFNSARQATINVCVPSEPTSGAYLKQLFNLSKNTANGVINVIFCHFSDFSTTPIHHAGFDYRLDIEIDKLINHPNAATFDETKPNALFLFFHNTSFDLIDRNYFFDRIENIYSEVIAHGNLNQDVPKNNKTNVSINVPRKVGLSLVIR